MSTFRRRFRIVLDDEPFEMQTISGDHLNAEQALAREKKTVDSSKLALQLRVMFNAFSRCYPEHPCARNWAKFQEVFDDLDDLEEEQGSPMDPTLEED